VREAGGSDPITPQTLFQAASISKPVTALAVLSLVEQGKLDLDEDVNMYLTSWKIPANGSWQPRITLRHLLSHIGGTTVHGFPGYRRDHAVPTLLQVLDGQKPANTAPIRVNAIPGTQFRYSGGGTNVVQQLLVDRLEKPFPEIMSEFVLAPLGMEESTYAQPLPDERADSAATGHGWVTGSPVAGKWHVYPEMAAAGLWTTPSDLARVAIAIQKALAGQTGTLLSPGMADQMLSPQAEIAWGGQIGLGFVLEGHGPSARFGHGGSNQGFQCELVAFKAGGCGAAVMTNADSGGAMIREILRAIATEYGWPDYVPAAPDPAEVDPHIYDGYVGEYELRPGFAQTVTRAGDSLFLQPSGQAAMELFPESDTKFFLQAVDAEVSFTTEAGQITALVLHQNGQDMSAQKRR
jgi:CubicO group peptidase (beta-lactamase class C family)